jgi:hypothetical protein
MVRGGRRGKTCAQQTPHLNGASMFATPVLAVRRTLLVALVSLLAAAPSAALVVGVAHGDDAPQIAKKGSFDITEGS